MVLAVTLLLRPR